MVFSLPKICLTFPGTEGFVVSNFSCFTDNLMFKFCYQLYIAPSAIGHGIGTLFVNMAKETLGSPIRLCTFQESINVQRFYERHGFRIIELRDGTANEEGCPDAVYEWL